MELWQDWSVAWIALFLVELLAFRLIFAAVRVTG